MKSKTVIRCIDKGKNFGKYIELYDKSVFPELGLTKDINKASRFGSFRLAKSFLIENEDKLAADIKVKSIDLFTEHEIFELKNERNLR